MAEDLVLANLVINADGTITAMNRAGQAVTTFERHGTASVGRLESQTRSNFDRIGLSSKRLVAAFVNVRLAVRALFLGFSAGGILLGIAQLITHTATATETFQKFKDIVTSAYLAVVGFFSRFAAAGIAAKQAGVATVEELQKRVVLLQRAIDLQIEFSGPNVVKNVSALRGELSKVNLQIATLGERAFDAASQFQKLSSVALTGGPAVSIFAAGGILRTLNSDLFRLQIVFEDTLGILKERLESGKIDLQEYESQVRSLRTAFESLVESMKKAEENLPKGPEKFPLPEDRPGPFGSDEDLEKTRLAYELLGQAFATTGQIFIDMVASGELSGKKLLAAVLRAIAAEAAAKGALSIADGFAALGRYDFVAASSFFIAAAKYFAVATLAAAGARAVGSGGAGGGRRERREARGFEETQAQLQRPAPNVTIVVDGGIFTGTPQELARTMLELQRQAIRDGA